MSELQEKLSTWVRLQYKPARYPWADYWDDNEWFWCQRYRTCSEDQSDNSHCSFKKLSPLTVTKLPFENARVKILCEVDEQWSFVGNKKNQRWLFYAWEPRFKRIIAHAFGRRSGKTLKKLLKRLKPYKFSFYCTDDWKPCSTNLVEDKHIVGKIFTQRIERQNLTLRTRLKRLMRRTICFSRSAEVHDKVIGEFISREHYQQVWFITQPFIFYPYYCPKVHHWEAGS